MQLSTTVSLTQHADIALICVDNPPVNAAGHDLRLGLVAAVDWLASHPEVTAAALYGAGRTFIAGADIREFGKPPQDPWLPEVCLRLEACPTPIACVLHGTTLGGGLEVAMSCHLRVALPGSKVGLPEVLLGILPGAGGTQRGPRLVGMAAALDVITTGQHIAAQQALEQGWVDHLHDGPTPQETALWAARALAEGLVSPRVTGDRQVALDEAALDAARARIRKKQPHLFSPLKCVEAVAASTLPLPQGIARERALFQECLDSPQRAGLIHAFFAERAVSKVPEAKVPPRAFDQIGIVGAGTMGSGIATACLLAGLQVVLTDADQDALSRGQAALVKNLDGAVTRGKLTEQGKGQALDRLICADQLTALSDCDVIIEAAFEDLGVKQALFRDLDFVAKPGAVLATNTSYLDVNVIGAVTNRPGDVMGLHFFSPAHVMRLLEVVVADKTAPDVAATGFALGKTLRKISVRAGVCDGFIGNRILMTTRRAVEYMMIDGAPFPQIDRALEGFGLAMGPFRVGDLAGLDIAWAQRKRRAATRPANERYVAVADQLCEAGHLGKKTGSGYYLSSGDPNPLAVQVVQDEQAAQGVAPSNFSDTEIVSRYTTAMIMEAAQIVEDGIALRPIDVDAVLLFGYGFPRHQGGPLHLADQIGIEAVIDRLETLAKEDDQFWRVPKLLRQMAKDSRVFADLNT